MKVLTGAEYADRKRMFLERHGNEWHVETSSMDEYGRYHKMYICKDGAVLTEVNEPEYKKAKAVATVCGIDVEIEQDVKLFRTEAWSTDDPVSVYHYELF